MLFVLVFLLLMSAVDEEKKSNDCAIVGILKYFFSLYHNTTDLIHEVSRSHTTTHHSRWDSSGRVIRPSRRPLPDNTQHPQQTDIQGSCVIRTHNLGKRAAETHASDHAATGTGNTYVGRSSCKVS
jgi:hypothetical protein